MKLIIPNNYKHKQKEAIKLVNKLITNYNLPLLIKAKENTSQQKEQSPWKSVRDYENILKDQVEKSLLDLFLEIRRKWLKQSGAFHKADSDLFKLNGKIYISPKTGKPLTKKQWAEVVKGLDSSLQKIFKDQPDYLIKKAMLLGKVLQGMDEENRIRESFNQDWLKGSLVDPIYNNSILFAEQYTAELITNLQSNARKRIANTITDAIRNQKSTRELELNLFEKFADVNKDWRRISETEISNNVNNGILLSELQSAEKGEPVFMIGVSADNACKHCQRLVSGKVVVLVSDPIDKEYIKIDGKKYDVIWPGKSNYGYSANNYQTAVLIHPHCYDKETEVLTNNGWKYFKNVERNDLIMSINPKTKEVGYVPFIKKVKYRYSGNMIHFKSRSYDLLVTPDHNMLYTTQSKKDRLFETPAQDLINLNSFALPKGVGVWKGFDEALLKISNRLKITLEDFVKLWAWFLSEGSISLSTNKGRSSNWQIQITQKNPLKIYKDLKSIQKYLKIGQSAVYIFNESFIDIFKEFYKIDSYHKYIPQIIKNLSLKYLNIFISTYIKGDGSNYVYNGNKSFSRGSERQVIYTCSDKLCSDISEIIIKLGKTPSFYKQLNKGKEFNFPNGIYKGNYDIWRINICKSKFKHFDKNVERNYKPYEVFYDDFVYDVELKKWHHLLVRRNGKVAWSGNCRCSWTRWYPELQRSFNYSKYLLNHLNNQTSSLIKSMYKSKGYPVGTERTWKGKNYIKQNNGKWIKSNKGKQYWLILNDKVIQNKIDRELNKWKELFKSPYSNSFYNKPVTWNYKEEGTLRISNHWNFISKGEKHCKLNITENYIHNRWILAKYKNGVWKFLKEFKNTKKEKEDLIKKQPLYSEALKVIGLNIGDSIKGLGRIKDFEKENNEWIVYFENDEFGRYYDPKMNKEKL